MEGAFQHFRVIAQHIVVAGLAAHAAEWTAHPFLKLEVFKTQEFKELKQRFLQELPVSKSVNIWPGVLVYLREQTGWQMVPTRCTGCAQVLDLRSTEVTLLAAGAGGQQAINSAAAADQLGGEPSCCVNSQQTHLHTTVGSKLGCCCSAGHDAGFHCRAEEEGRRQQQSLVHTDPATSECSQWQVLGSIIRCTCTPQRQWSSCSVCR